MSDKLLPRPTFRCDSGPGDVSDGVSSVALSSVAPGRVAPSDDAARVEERESVRSGLPMNVGASSPNSGLGVALARDPADAAWRDLLDAFAGAGLPLVRLSPERAEALVDRGVPSAIVHRLVHGYPAAPLRMGTLHFFPPLTSFFELRRLPDHFYVAEAYEGAHVFKRRVRQALDLEQSESSEAIDTEDADKRVDLALLRAATRYVEAFGARPATSRDPGAQNSQHWLPGAEAALGADSGQTEHVAVLGPLMSWEDYRAELERRLMVARLWCLIGLVAAVAALSQSGALSSRLLIAFGAVGIVGGGLGLAPWLRATSRLRELIDADPTRREALVES